ncbi:MAG: DeoR/GlpR family DNA-binding transcription regulator [Verrucomicrobiota bacterium]
MRKPKAVVDQRRAELAEWIKQKRFLSVQAVCEKYNISEATARRDLRELESQKAIVRTFGGATGDFDQTFQSFAARMDKGSDKKKMIAAAAGSSVSDEQIIFLDGGSTLFYLACELAKREWKALTIVTNNLAAAEALSQQEGIQVVLTGGRFLGRQSVLIGPSVLHSLNQYAFHQSFLSAQAVSNDGVWNTGTEIVEVQKKIQASSERSHLLFHQDKWKASGDTFLCLPSDFDTFFTDVPVRKLGVIRHLPNAPEITTI